MVLQYNCCHQDVTYQEGNWVFLKRPPQRTTQFKGAGQQKLLSRYVGPYKISRQTGKLPYELLLPTGSSIHPVFHVSRLKPCTTVPTSNDIQSAPILEEPPALSPLRRIGMRKALSIAVDTMYVISTSSDGDKEVNESSGQTLSIGDGTVHVTSSSLHSNKEEIESHYKEMKNADERYKDQVEAGWFVMAQGCVMIRLIKELEAVSSRMGHRYQGRVAHV
ncbi:hypothetical protein EJ110_NYTH19087 [Nymphaea thermarum]|nr:hypothetical protein EJ110_NYTH19087 [Nymphaea thermarum]